jgi:hypothetical protein
MIDINDTVDGDLGTSNTQVFRAKNILSIQIGSLTYAPDLGIDLDYFLNEEFSFQNISFQSYLVQRLSTYSINISSIVETVNALFEEWDLNLSPVENSTSMLVR